MSERSWDSVSKLSHRQWMPFQAFHHAHKWKRPGLPTLDRQVGSPVVSPSLPSLRSAHSWGQALEWLDAARPLSCRESRRSLPQLSAKLPEPTLLRPTCNGPCPSDTEPPNPRVIRTHLLATTRLPGRIPPF